MRFAAQGPDIPLELLEARDRGEVVFFCGAGVSMPAGLPSFRDLARNVVTDLGGPGLTGFILQNPQSSRKFAYDPRLGEDRRIGLPIDRRDAP